LGYSDRATRGFVDTPAEQAARLRLAAAALGADRPILVGHSYGGAVALAWALEHPDSVSALVLIGAASNPWQGSLGWLYRLGETRLGEALIAPPIAAYAPLSRVRTMLDQVFAPQTPPDGYAAYLGIGLILREAPFRNNLRQVNGLLPHVRAMVPRYPSMRLPVEIVHGTDDRIVPLPIHSEPLARQIPDARLTRLAGIGHMAHHCAPGAVDAAIDRAAIRAGLQPARASDTLSP
jgi:pimeloyl-ACP methyl ester carboxylesterase